MAECLSPTPVTTDQFFAVYVGNTSVESQVRRMATQLKVALSVEVNNRMFL